MRTITITDSDGVRLTVEITRGLGAPPSAWPWVAVLSIGDGAGSVGLDRAATIELIATLMRELSDREATS